MTDTSTRPATAPTVWQHASPLRTAVELLLGLSFCVTVAAGLVAGATGHATVVAPVAAAVFVVTLTCTLVTWFRGAEVDAR